MLPVWGSCPENGKWLILSRRGDQSEELTGGLDFTVGKASWPSPPSAVQLPLLPAALRGAPSRGCHQQDVGTATHLCPATHKAWGPVITVCLLPPRGLLRTCIYEQPGCPRLLSPGERAFHCCFLSKALVLFVCCEAKRAKVCSSSSVCSPRSSPGFWGQAKSQLCYLRDMGPLQSRRTIAGLCQKKCEQQHEGVASAPLLCS